ncbi:1-phosphofructokinase [Sneathia sanguinegens]|jgi:hypothetical protein|uniref:1-phosphofructokinase n=1 Tax=Sneathia sanguinegens TaxID=40543 RepID=UPI000834F3C7|nr:1-phosphofructokinase [Sneathia sanguinegens]
MIYTVTLNPALDYDIYSEKFELKKLNETKKIEFRAGGKGINVSIMLNNLNVETIALGFIGGFTGEYILKSLNKQNIMSDFIEIEDTNRINIKLKVGEKEETEIAGVSPVISKENLEKLKEKISKLREEDILVLAGSIPTCFSEKLYKDLANITKAKVVLDTRGELLLENISNNLLIKPNKKELEEAFNIELKTNEQIYEVCKKFLEKGVENVLVSLGKDGAILVKKNKMLVAKVPKGIMINTIGAGDSTVAGFLTGYTQKLTDVEILRLAVACGSATAYSYGIGKKKMVYELIKNIECEEISYGH